MNTNFLFIYDLEKNHILADGFLRSHYEYQTCSGDVLVFEATQNGLRFKIPFFLLDNIFYFRRNNILYFGRSLSDFKDLTSPDLISNGILNQAGFIPHSRTQLVGVSIVCSYLSYLLSKHHLVIDPCYPGLKQDIPYEIDDLIECLRDAFRKQIERVNQENFVLPLSGGMDSRLLLNMALEIKDLKVDLFTLGTERSGDVIVARQIASSLGMRMSHTVFNLEQLNRDDLVANYQKCDYLVPLDRVLGTDLGNFFKKSAIISGLYGDVIFADNFQESATYEEYILGEHVIVDNEEDRKIVAAYNKLPRLPKLHRTLLRCQKLTRQSFPLSPGFQFITPFIDPQVMTVASRIKIARMYPSLIKKYMRPSLSRVIHQSTLSYFTHPSWMRFLERKIFKLAKHSARFPYFDAKYLRDIGVAQNEAPPIDF